MNRKFLLVSAISAAILFCIAGLAVYLHDRLSVLYECKMEFLYEDVLYRSQKGTPSPDQTGIYVENRHMTILSELNGESYPFAVDEMVRRCQSHPRLREESEQRTRVILSSRRIDVVEMASTNSVYKYRLVLTDNERRNLDEYARLYMEMIKEKLERETKIRADKASSYENQRMRRAERHVKEIEEFAKKEKLDAAMEEDLRLARQTVREMEEKIDEIRAQVMSKGIGRITWESSPGLSWHIQFCAEKLIQGRQQ